MTISYVAEEAARRQTVGDVWHVIIVGGLHGAFLRNDAVAEVMPQHCG